jgi:hypothetical protein
LISRQGCLAGDVETEKTGLDGRFFCVRDLVDFASSVIPPFSLID